MQHHGCPTRLLDWSDSILVALYFAVMNDIHMREDGEIWCLHPGALNLHATGHFGIEGDDSADVTTLAADATKEFDPSGEQKSETELLPEYPIAIAPSLWFRRGVNQLSRFTIHPKPGQGRKIEETLSYPNLVRYLIPNRKKQELKDVLCFLGIRPDTMFPDLDGLSHGVCAFADLIERGAILCSVCPPECDGEVSPKGTVG
jgi:hypothetical protein